MESRRVVCGPFVLIGAMNPCPCGYYGDPVQECTCSHSMVSRYRADTRHPPHLGATARPDRHAERIEVPRVEYDKLSDNCNIHRLWESSKD